MKQNTKICVAAQRVVLAAAVLCAADASALGLGAIQVNSYLGEPLRAQVPVLQLSDSDVEDIKIRLGNVDEYRKHNLTFPEETPFKFQLVSEPNGKRYIRISTTKPVEDPFLEVLLNFSTPSSKASRAFTFLLDPHPDIGSPLTQAPATVETTEPAATDTTVKPLVKVEDLRKRKPARAQTARTQTKRAKSSNRTTVASVPAEPFVLNDNLSFDEPKKSSDSSSGGRKTKKFGKLSLALSTTLSISKSSPAGKGGSPDAMREEVVAKEKRLKELNSQVNELQTAVTTLNGKPVSTPNAAAPSVPAPSSAGTPPATASNNAGAGAQPPMASNSGGGASTNGAGEAVAIPAPTGIPVGPLAASSVAVAESGVVPVGAENAASDVAAVHNPVSQPVATEEPAIVDGGGIGDLVAQYWLEAIGGLTVLLMGALGVMLLRNRKGGGSSSGSWAQQNPFKRPPVNVKVKTPPTTTSSTTKVEPRISEPAQQTAAVSQETPVVTKTAPQQTNVKPAPAAAKAEPAEQNVRRVEAPAIKTAEKPKTTEFNAPPEYDLLEEADIYLRFGHNKLAEEVLREAIKMNPKNSHSYLTLLGVYEMRADLKEFEELARQLQPIATDDDWKKATEMGRKLDPDNPMYADKSASSAPAPAAVSPAKGGGISFVDD